VNSRSVRLRATVGATLLAALALTAAGVALVAILQWNLTRSDDDLARSRLADIAGLAASGNLPKVLRAIGDDSVAQVVADDGTVLARSPNILGAPRIAGFRPGTTPVVHTVRGPDDQETEDYRLWGQHAGTPDGPVTVYVGSSLESAQEVTGRLTRLLLLGLPLVLALVAGAVWLVIGRTLRPVERIRAEVAEISERALDRRVPLPGTGDEVQRLAETMNQMLDRLESAALHQRDFVANASHDLQSPLSVIRTELDVAAAHPDATDWSQTVQTLRVEADRMERLVRDLLFLARADTAPPAATGLVDLDDVVLEEVARIRDATSLEIDTSAVSAAPVRGSRDDLARLVRNLLANACAHAASKVVVTTGQVGDAVLVVEDDGPGVAAEHRARVFDRFYRADPVRARDGAGTGLGLAIVRSVTEEHGGTVELDEAGAGARFVVRLPVG
jgi:signal transduction histidine kinase